MNIIYIYVCMYACMHSCMHACIYIYIYLNRYKSVVSISFFIMACCWSGNEPLFKALLESRAYFPGVMDFFPFFRVRHKCSMKLFFSGWTSIGKFRCSQPPWSRNPQCFPMEECWSNAHGVWSCWKQLPGPPIPVLQCINDPALSACPAGWGWDSHSSCSPVYAWEWFSPGILWPE